MNITSSDQLAHLQQLRTSRPSYKPSGVVEQALADKILIALVGPSAIGKTTLMNHVVNAYADFSYVHGFTTRDRRSDDDSNLYRFIENSAQLEQVFHDIDEGRVVQYAPHPTNDALYGSYADDYPARYNLHDCLASEVDTIRELPFDTIIPISITSEPRVWYERFVLRFPQPTSERTSRLQEAQNSIQWSLSQSSHHFWIINREDKVDEASTALIDIVHNNSQDKSLAVEYAQQILKLIENLQH